MCPACRPGRAPAAPAYGGSGLAQLEHALIVGPAALLVILKLGRPRGFLRHHVAHADIVYQAVEHGADLTLNVLVIDFILIFFCPQCNYNVR